MGYLIFFLLTMMLLSALPYLLPIIAIVWVITMVLNIFRPNRRPTSRTYTQQQQNPRQEQARPKPSGDIIDVEYTQRDAE